MKKSGWIVSPSPFLRTRPTVSRMSLVISLTLLPQILLVALEHDIQALTVIILAVAGSVLAEFFHALSERKSNFSDGTVLVAGVLTGLLLPLTLNPFFVFAISFSGFFVSRVLFGGTGSYWMNPVAVVVSIAFISQPNAFPAFLVHADGIQTVGDAFGSLRLDHFAQIPPDQSITGAMNGFFLGFFGIKLPEGYITLFLHSPSVIPAFRYNVWILVSSIILIAMNIIDWIIPLFFLLAYGICIRLFSLVPFGAGFSTGDILFALLTSGILFIAFYVLPEFTTSPRTRGGKTASGILAGITAFLLCGPGGSSAGGVFTVVLVNAVNTVIEYIENRYIASAGDMA